MKTGPAWVSVAVLAVLVFADAATDVGRQDVERRAERRRWALARMDEMASEGRRCAERFRDRRQVDACRADFSRRYREYNEMYLDAARE